MFYPTNPWDPFEMMERMLSRWGTQPAAGSPGLVVQSLPVMGMKQTDQELIVRVEVPGISPEDLNVTVADGAITIQGTWRGGDEEADGNGAFRHGTFERSLAVPPNVDLDKATAHYHQGVLEIHLPRREGQGGRQLKIKLN